MNDTLDLFVEDILDGLDLDDIPNDTYERILSEPGIGPMTLARVRWMVGEKLRRAVETEYRAGLSARWGGTLLALSGGSEIGNHVTWAKVALPESRVVEVNVPAGPHLPPRIDFKALSQELPRLSHETIELIRSHAPHGVELKVWANGRTVYPNDDRTGLAMPITY